MVLKRFLRAGGEEDSELPNKRRHFPSTLSRGINSDRALQEVVPRLEPLIRKWVQEAVDSSIDRVLRCSHTQIECSESRTLQLRFHSNLPRTLFTGSRVVSDDGNLIKILLFDPSTQQVLTHGPLSSIKVNIVVLDSDFGPPDRESWSKKDFDGNIIHKREGKRPLVTGERTITLQNGVGCISEVSFTDNSSWTRNGKFKLGVKVHNISDEARIREGMSNAFKVKDHRGESYQKHYPPVLKDEVWRLEKIAKDGASHKRLSQLGISSVGDLLRLYNRDQSELRAMLPNISNKTWDAIIRHAKTCTLDDKKYMYRTALGTCLFFNSIFEVVGATFDGQNYHSLENLNNYQLGIVEDLKQHAYRNLKGWTPVGDPLLLGYPTIMGTPAANLITDPSLGMQNNIFQEQDPQEYQMNIDKQSISPPYNSSSFDLGGSSYQRQGYNPIIKDAFGMSDSSGELCIGGSTWVSGANYIGSQLSTDDIPVDDNFQVESSLWQGNGLFLDSTNHEAGIMSSNSGIFIIPRNGKSKARWCKVLAVVKWRILVRRNVAARRWKQYYDYMSM